MDNGARYVVQTRWGVFSLDEGSYQDYLAGKLWISWDPAKPATPEQGTDHEAIPPHVSKYALALRKQAEQDGLFAVLEQTSRMDIIVPYSERLADLSIDELNLTVRSSNGLKRANAGTFRRVKELLERENGLLSVRNLGMKSEKEILRVFFEECYSRLLPYEKAQYWQTVLDGKHTEPDAV